MEKQRLLFNEKKLHWNDGEKKLHFVSLFTWFVFYLPPFQWTGERFSVNNWCLFKSQNGIFVFASLLGVGFP